MGTSKKKYGIWILGVVLLAISLVTYVPVSLGLAKGYMLAAGQVLGLAAGAFYLVFLKGRAKENCTEQGLQNEKKTGLKKSASIKSLHVMLKNTLTSVCGISAFLCCFWLLTFPVQKLLSEMGLASLNECAHYDSLWEMLLYVLILPPVCMEVLHRFVILPELTAVFSKRWQVLLLSGLFYTFSAPQIGNFFARFVLGVLLALLFLRTKSFLTCFCGALAAQSVFFVAGYMQILGFAGAEAYTLSQCIGMGLSFASPGVLLFYFGEKYAAKTKIKAVESVVLVCILAFAFALGMALWLG